MILTTLMVPSPEALSKSEQEAIQAVALKHFLTEHPPSGQAPWCLAVGGYKAPTQSFRALLQGIKLDKDQNCHFREGGLVYSTTRVVINSKGLAELEVSKLEFGHVSSSIERQNYILQKGPTWQVVSAEQAVQ